LNDECLIFFVHEIQEKRDVVLILPMTLGFDDDDDDDVIPKSISSNSPP